MSTGGPAGQGSVDGFAEKVREGFGGLFSRAGEGAGRLREAARGLTRSPLLQQAEAARDRGNLEAAFWLLREAFGDDPDEPGVAVAFWDVSVSLDRADAARRAAVGLVERHAAAREVDLAIQYWDELASRVPGAFVSPAAVARMLPELTALAERLLAGPNPAEDETDPREQQHDHALMLARRALLGSLDPDNAPLTPGLALRLAEDGREVDLDVARKIAGVAMAAPELHEVKRERLASWAADARFEPVSPEPRAEDDQPELPNDPPPPLVLSEHEIAAAAARLRERKAAESSPTQSSSPTQPGGTKDPAIDATIGAATSQQPTAEVLEAFPLALETDALVLRMGDRRQSRVPYDRIEALAAVEIVRDDQPAVVVIDLALNWTRRDREPLRLVRLRTNTFDPKSLVADCPPEEALSCLLAELLERSHAVPLPDPESALGLCLARFQRIEDYEIETLGLR